MGRANKNANQEGFLEQPFSLCGKRVWVAGHRGLVGSALMRRLEQEDCELITAGWDELELRDQDDVHHWVKDRKPDVTIIAAARVGGIAANMNAPADFIYDNLMIASNIIHEAYRNDTEKLLFLGSSCIYPKNAQNPITEESLLSGALEATNEPYAIAKIAGIKLCESYRIQHGCDFISAMPCNLYGPGDRFDKQKSHVIPALMMRAHEAKMTHQPELSVWGTGTPRREFLHADDLADGLIFLLQNYSEVMHINIGAGEDISISDLADLVCDTVEYNGELVFDPSQPDGVQQKLIDSSRIRKAGWSPQTSLKMGLKKTYAWYRQQLEEKYAA